VYSFKFARQPNKFLSKLNDKSRFVSALRVLSEDPLSGKKLHPPFEKGERSKRVGDYRIIYTFNSRGRTIYVLAIEHRKESYR